MLTIKIDLLPDFAKPYKTKGYDVRPDLRQLIFLESK